MTTSNQDRAQTNALQSIARSMETLNKNMERIGDTLVELGKMFRGALEDEPQDLNVKEKAEAALAEHTALMQDSVLFEDSKEYNPGEDRVVVMSTETSGTIRRVNILRNMYYVQLDEDENGVSQGYEWRSGDELRMIPQENETLPLRWGHETVGTAKVERDNTGNLTVTGVELDQERLPDVLKENVQHFSLPSEEA